MQFITEIEGDVIRQTITVGRTYLTEGFYFERNGPDTDIDLFDEHNVIIGYLSTEGKHLAIFEGDMDKFNVVKPHLFAHFGIAEPLPGTLPEEKGLRPTETNERKYDSAEIERLQGCLKEYELLAAHRGGMVEVYERLIPEGFNHLSR